MDGQRRPRRRWRGPCPSALKPRPHRRRRRCPGRDPHPQHPARPAALPAELDRATRWRHQPGLRQRLCPHPSRQHAGGAARDHGLVSARLPAGAAYAGGAWRGVRPLVRLDARPNLDEPAVRPYRHQPRPHRRTRQPVRPQSASLQRTHAVRRIDRRRRPLADLLRRRPAVAGADPSVAPSRELSRLQALGSRRQGRRRCPPTASSSRPISAPTRTTSTRRTTSCAAMR